MNDNAYSIIIAKDNDFLEVAKLWQEFKVVRGDDYYPVGAVNLSQEIAALPEPYNQVGNFVLVAQRLTNNTPLAVGCVSLKKYSHEIAEVRRMYVKPDERGNQLGLKLMLELIKQAKVYGYNKLYLDSLKKFTHAHALYEGLGFSYISAYDAATTQEMKDNMIFMEMNL
jgi:GNAT superfamily N-acetyltransferase